MTTFSIATTRRAIGLLLGCAAALFLTTPAWASSGYGELAHFGEPGTGKGQFNLVEASGLTDAIGVDQTTKAVYVVDGPTKKEFRIQKFEELQPGKWQQVAERKFKPGVPRVAGIEGVAVDHANNEVYVLALEERPETAKVDPETVAAGALFAFTASTLEPAPGTTEGLLDDAKALQTVSDAASASLLEPAGIAVDPTNGDLIVLASVDPTGEGEPLQTVLQRIEPTGTLGARWTDTGGFFTSEGALKAEPTSPVVSPSGHVYVADGELLVPTGTAEEIDEVPSEFASNGTPVPVTEFNSEQLITFPGIPAPAEGSGLALGADGNFYAYAQLVRPEGDEPAVLAFGPSGSEVGWFGGQNQPKEGGQVPCAVSFRGHPVVAAGTGGDVFVFDSDANAPDVVELGPGGTGCPTASATSPAAFVNNEPVSGAVKVGAPVKFASTLTLANALAVEWEFVNKATKATEKVAGPPNELAAPEITHTFAAEGEYQVKELIADDDLASPALVKETTIAVKGLAPTAQFNAKTEVNVGESATFDAKNSSGGSSPITGYTWEFGDGSAPVTTKEPTIAHAFAAPETYTVKLTVQTAAGPSAPFAKAIKVVAPSSGGGGGGGANNTPPPPPPPPAGTSTTASGTGAVLSYQASIAGASVTVSSSGVLTIKVSCGGSSSCTGTVTLRTKNAVAAKRKAILTLGSASFAASAGSVKSVTLHLSAKGRALLARSHTLAVVATIAARDSSNGAHTSTAVLTLRLAKAHRKH